MLSWRYAGRFCKIETFFIRVCEHNTLLQNIRVVLVNTSHPGNIGGAARAMKNMGLARLVLVQPKEFPAADASARASGADDVLDNAQVVDSLEQALVGCNLVFGREHAGLTNEELQRCHFHVHIPSNPDFSSLNLAAAVQVLSYEVRMASLAVQGVAPKVEKADANELATMDEMELFYDHLEKTLVDIGFLDPAKPKHLMPRMRRLYGRSSVERTEMSILRGILTETQKVVRGEPHKRKD